MPELQPRRNPRPAPHPREIQPQLASRLAPNWVRAWWPAAFWVGAIFLFSTDTFSADHTASVFEPLLRFFWRSMTKSDFAVAHFLIRKSAHFTEYFVLCLLLYRGLRGGRKGWRWSWALTALCVAAGYSALDEVHQAFIASRTASAYDSLVDSTGAFVAVLAMWAWFRRRQTRGGETETAPSA